MDISLEFLSDNSGNTTEIEEYRSQQAVYPDSGFLRKNFASEAIDLANVVHMAGVDCEAYLGKLPQGASPPPPTAAHHKRHKFTRAY